MGQILGKAKGFVTDKLVPVASIKDFDLGSVHRDRVEYNAKVPVVNPLPLSLPICEVSYTLTNAGRKIISGKMEDPGNLKAKDITVLTVRLIVPYDIIVSLAKDVGKDWDIDYELEVGLVIDLPIIGNFTIPLSKQGQIKLPSFGIGIGNLFFSQSDDVNSTNAL